MRGEPNQGRAPLRNQRGQSLPLLAIGMLALMGLAAGAVDIGRHAFTATELQNLADSAASAAAKVAGNYCTTGGTGGICAPNVAASNAAAYSAAQTMAQYNKVDGEVTGFAASDVVVGRYDAGTFTPSAQPSNAVRATARKTINNIIAGMIGNPTSTITRTATATIVGVGAGLPTMPIALGDSYWNNCINFGCAQPELVLVPDTIDNAGWTTFFLNNVSQPNIKGYIPSPCGGGVTPPYIKVGDMIQLGNGQGNALNAVQCLVCNQGQNNFLVPIVHTSKFNQAAPVVGFATIVVDKFNYSTNPKVRSCGESGGGSLKGFTVRSVFNANVTGPSGPGFYGSGWAQMVG